MAKKFMRPLALAIAVVNAATLLVNSSDPAEAAIVHVGTGSQLSGANATLNLDFNLDSVLDAYFSQMKTSSKAGPGPTTQTTTYAIAGLNGTMLTGGGPLADGALIDGNLAWSSTTQLGKLAKAGSTRTYSGSWLNGSSTGSGFLGFSLSLADGVHFGWIELALDAAAGTNDIIGYAYETVAGRSIAAGATVSPPLPSIPVPATGALLLGALAAPLALRRRKSAPGPRA